MPGEVLPRTGVACHFAPFKVQALVFFRAKRQTGEALEAKVFYLHKVDSTQFSAHTHDTGSLSNLRQH